MLAGVIIPVVTAMAWGAFQSSQRSSILHLASFHHPFIHSLGPLFPNAVHVIDNIQVNVKWAMMMTMVVVKWNPSVGALACHDSLLTDDWGERLVTLFAFQIVYSVFFKFCILNFGFIFLS